MIQSYYIIRPARKDEAGRIAEFYRISSDGVADYIWSKLALPGESLLEVGRRRYERDDTAFSWRNCTVVQKDGALVAMLVAFPLRADPDYVEPDPVLAPYSRLEEDRSYYVCGLAVEARYRRRGIARDLMIEAEEACRRQGLSKLSLIVFERNAVARTFYERLGFVEKARHPIVPHPLIHYTGDALLMVKHLDLHH